MVFKEVGVSVDFVYVPEVIEVGDSSEERAGVFGKGMESQAVDCERDKLFHCENLTGGLCKI